MDSELCGGRRLARKERPPSQFKIFPSPRPANFAELVENAGLQLKDKWLARVGKWERDSSGPGKPTANFGHWDERSRRVACSLELRVAQSMAIGVL